MLKEFKQFALKGNVLDLAIAVVIGAAFSKIVTSLVNDLIMPILSLLLGRINFATLKYDIPSSIAGAADISIKYGLFIQAIIDFLIIAFSLFIFIKINYWVNPDNKTDKTVEIIQLYYNVGKPSFPLPPHPVGFL